MFDRNVGNAYWLIVLVQQQMVLLQNQLKYKRYIQCGRLKSKANEIIIKGFAEKCQ